MHRCAVFAALFCCSFLAVAYGESAVASVKTAKGSCSVQRASQTITVSEGMHLDEGDVLKTGNDGYLSFIMRDGTRISLGPDTELTVSEFAYDPGHDKLALVLKLGHGMLAYISGKIASFSPEAVKVQTPTALIGVRGTRFVVGLGVVKGTP